VVLPRFVTHPFTPQVDLDFKGIGECASVLVRMLDNVLDLS
jgi:hypothetical protein